MEKVKVAVCCGTTCYLMGNFELLNLRNILDSEVLEKIEIVGSPCLGYCSKGEEKPPFAKVNGRLISRANPHKLISEIMWELER